MKNLLLGIAIGICIIAFVKASNPLDLGQVVWLPATYGTVNGHGYDLGLAPDGTVYGKNSVVRRPLPQFAVLDGFPLALDL